MTGVPRLHCGRCTVCDWLSPRCYGGNFCGFHEYRHVGTPAFLPRKGRGDLLVSPTGVERLLYLHFPRSVAAHQTKAYAKYLLQTVAHIPDLLDDEDDEGVRAEYRTSGGGPSWISSMLSSSELSHEQFSQTAAPTNDPKQKQKHFNIASESGSSSPLWGASASDSEESPSPSPTAASESS